MSNSSWANEGYLVATSISTSEVEEELRMLSALHGIGVILLIPENQVKVKFYYLLVVDQRLIGNPLIEY